MPADRTGMFPDGFCEEESCDNALSSDEEVERKICDDCALAEEE